MLFMKEKHNNIMNHLSNIYSDNQKTGELKDDIKAIRKCVWYCYKANRFTRKLLNHLQS